MLSFCLLRWTVLRCWFFQKWYRNGLPFKAKLQCIGLHLRHICLTSIVLQRPRVDFGLVKHQETSGDSSFNWRSLHVTQPWCHGGADRMGQLWVICCDLLGSVEPFCRIGHWNTLEHTGTGSILDRLIFKGLHCNKKSVQQNPKLDPTCPGKIDNHIHSIS